MMSTQRLQPIDNRQRRSFEACLYRLAEIARRALDSGRGIGQHDALRRLPDGDVRTAIAGVDKAVRETPDEIFGLCRTLQINAIRTGAGCEKPEMTRDGFDDRLIGGGAKMNLAAFIRLVAQPCDKVGAERPRRRIKGSFGQRRFQGCAAF